MKLKQKQLEWYLKYIDENDPIPVFDYNAIDKKGFPVNVLISNRGDYGKTHGARDFIYDKWLKFEHKTWWVRNQTDQQDDDREHWYDNLSNDWKENTILEKNYIYSSHIEETIKTDKDGIEKISYKTILGESFLRMVLLGKASNKKGGRDKKNKYLIYEEMNEGLRLLSKIQTAKFFNILGTMTDQHSHDVIKGINPIKVFILMNLTTLTTPLLIDMGVVNVENEVTEVFDDYGNKQMLILMPKPDEKEMEIRHKNDWMYQLAKKSKQHRHMFLNENLYDNLFHIINKKDMEIIPKDLLQTILYQGRYYQIYWFGDGLIYVEKMGITRDDGLIPCIAGTSKSVEDGVPYLDEPINILWNYRTQEKVWYDSSITKLMVNNITKNIN